MPTAVAIADIAGVTVKIWQSVLGLELTEQREGFQIPSPMLLGCVQISGAWTGAVEIASSEPMARSAAALMLQLDAAELGDGDVRDAFGELANMIGGNLKALLPGPSQLSPPVVVKGSDFTVALPGTTLLSRGTFRCNGEPVMVTVMIRA